MVSMKSFFLFLNHTAIANNCQKERKVFNITMSIHQFTGNSYPTVALEIDLPVIF